MNSLLVKADILHNRYCRIRSTRLDGRIKYNKYNFQVPGDNSSHLKKSRNEKGQRFSTNRWSSRLAFTRATHITELLLESAAEWEIYESLCAQGVQFKLVAIPPGRKKHSGSTGRVWFIVGSYRCRYLGGNYFEFYVGKGNRRELSIKDVTSKMCSNIKVHTYSGYKADEYPKSFELEGNKLQVMEIRSHWLEPSCQAFKVLAEDGHIYILKKHFMENEGWELQPGK